MHILSVLVSEAMEIDSSCHSWDHLLMVRLTPLGVGGRVGGLLMGPGEWDRVSLEEWGEVQAREEKHRAARPEAVDTCHPQTSPSQEVESPVPCHPAPTMGGKLGWERMSKSWTLFPRRPG